MGKNTPRANKRAKKDDSTPEITPATSAKRSKRRNSHEKQSSYRVTKRDAKRDAKRDVKRDKRAKQDGSLVKEVSPNTGVLNRKGADAGDDDDDANESPPIPPQKTPDTKRKLQPELETPKQQPIPVYDAATEARKLELDQAANQYMADNEFESMGRGNAETRYRDNQYERQRIQEELDEDDNRYWEKHNLDSAIF